MSILLLKKHVMKLLKIGDCNISLNSNMSSREIAFLISHSSRLTKPKTRKILKSYIKKNDPAFFKLCKKVGKENQFVKTDNFLNTYEWRKLRYKALIIFGRKCQCCGATPDNGIRLNVDHIKPRKKYPELALELSNLQILCSECNHGKSNWNETDFRRNSEIENSKEFKEMEKHMESILIN